MIEITEFTSESTKKTEKLLKKSSKTTKKFIKKIKKATEKIIEKSKQTTKTRILSQISEKFKTCLNSDNFISFEKL